MGREEPERGRQVQNYLSSGYMQRPWHQPCGTLCASQANGLSPCSAAQFLSHRQAPPPLNTHTHTHTLTHSSFTLTHILSLTHTHTQAQSIQEHRHRKHGDPGAVLTHQAHGACGNGPESQLSSVIWPSTHWEPLGLLEAPWEQGRPWRDSGWPSSVQTKPHCSV